MHRGVACALASAVLFGASTPFAKMLSAHMPPQMLAGLLYMGSGLGLLVCLLLRRLAQYAARTGTPGHSAGAVQAQRAPASNALPATDLPWLAGAILAGGVAAPVLLMTGLGSTPASSASLLLNLEGVLTALLAWFVFHENVDRRIFFGMLLIVLAGVLLSWRGQPAPGVPWGALAIAAACLCWAIDNNLTRKVSAGDALQIAALKGLAAGAVNLSLALALGAHLPAAALVSGAAVVGFAGYGISLVLFVLALRLLGTARTGAYFSAAPFAGALLSLCMPGEAPGMVFWLAAAMMGLGICLHLSERHQHAHSHEALEHSHEHSHDEHHQHQHDDESSQLPDNGGRHSHLHRHAPLSHSHAHFPDIHHRHPHRK
jgi:drug/metabolite transporter (DMT)-like permease